jgi:TolB-like protein/Flp pilus assembly protein TadD
VSLIAELKRRSVFKVGAAYLVVGWLVVQAASIAFPAFDASPTLLRGFILIVALGFPIALVMAWMLEVTPEGVKVDELGVGSKRMFTIAAILAALTVGWFLRGGVGGGAHEFEAPLGEKSTAVLPFVNMSSDKENDYFSDGLTETLLHKLAQVTELKVAARTSSFAFKDKQQDIRSIGRELGVATVVEGSVQRAGDTLRITAQLVRTADGSHIWSRNYDRKLADLFAVQDEIAGAVTEALVGALVPEAKAAIAKGGTQDLAAYDLYTQALARRAINSFDSLKDAEALLKQAIERDPKFVDAMLAQCWIWVSMAGTGIITLDAAQERIDKMLDRVEALAPGEPSALVLRGVRANQRGEGEAARALFERGIALAPADAHLLTAYAINLDTAKPDEAAKALELIGRAEALDPLNALILYQHAGLLQGLERFDEAIAIAEKLVKVSPQSPLGYQMIGELKAAKGLFAEEFANWRLSQRLDPTDHELAAELALQLEKLGDRASADLWLAKSLAIAPGNFYPLAMEVQLAYRRSDHATAYAKALPLMRRHDESRRGNWTLAMGQGCLAALALGKEAEFRQALIAARMLPEAFSEAAVKALVTDRMNAGHVLAHFGDVAPCAFGSGPDRAARLAEVDALGTALVGAGWTDGTRNPALVALVKGDRAKFAAKLAEFAADGADLTRIEGFARWAGVADDPALAKAIADRKAQYAVEAARLPAVVAAAKVSAAP